MKLDVIKRAGKEYVLVPRKQWDALNARARERASSSLPVRPIRALRDGTYTIEHVRLSLASKMLARRRAAGLTQARLAALARVRVETISRLENGQHMPGAGTFARIDRALTRASKKVAA